MMSLRVLAGLALAIPSALAHWNYNNLYHNGQLAGAEYEYVRRTSNSNSPVTDVLSTDMRCNVGGASGASTKTLTVQAGDSIGFSIASSFSHPGIQQVYLSKAPSTAASYDGSGDWARIYSLTTKSAGPNGLTWAADNISQFHFDIPAETPSGEYLVRAEGLALHASGKYGGAQFYIGCAQIKVEKGGSGKPSPTVKYPGAYTGNEPGILFELYWPIPTSYTAPGPALWPSSTKEQHAP